VRPKIVGTLTPSQPSRRSLRAPCNAPHRGDARRMSVTYPTICSCIRKQRWTGHLPCPGRVWPTARWPGSLASHSRPSEIGAPAGVVLQVPQITASPCCPRCYGTPLDEPAYAYLFGLYLGDGNLARHRRGVFALSIACADAWPGLITAAKLATRGVMPSSGARACTGACACGPRRRSPADARAAPGARSARRTRGRRRHAADRAVAVLDYSAAPRLCARGSPHRRPLSLVVGWYPATAAAAAVRSHGAVHSGQAGQRRLGDVGRQRRQRRDPLFGAAPGRDRVRAGGPGRGDRGAEPVDAAPRLRPDPVELCGRASADPAHAYCPVRPDPGRLTA